MNKLYFLLFLLVLMIVPSICSAQPAIVNDCRIQRCYTVLFPFPHNRCECVEHYYYPLYVPPRHRYMPPPPHRGPRPGHHPPPPPHNHHHGPGPRR